MRTFTTYLINLDQDTERLAFMDTQLRSLGIPYIRQRGVLGNEASAEVGANMLAGELGCAASHKRTYQALLASDAEFALVLEDDVRLPDDFKERLHRELNRSRISWEYLLFDYWEPGIPFLSLWFSSVYSTIRSAKNPLLFFWHILYGVLKMAYIVPLSVLEGIRNAHARTCPGPVTFYRPLYLAGAYLVSRSGAQKLLSLAEPIVYTADALPNEASRKKGLVFKAYAPCCVRQEKNRFGSSILELPGFGA